MSYSYYFFEPLNPEVFIQNPGLLQFEEIGPLVFDENFTKIDIVFENDETSVRYKEQRFYTFNQNLSAPKINLNTITQSAALLNGLNMYYPSTYKNVIGSITVSYNLFKFNY